MWLNLLGMGVKTAAKLYQDKQKTKEALSGAKLLHAEKMRRGEIEFSKVKYLSIRRETGKMSSY
jgi:hypothetical protein